MFWEGYEANQDSWESARNLKNVPDAIKEFHRLHPHAHRLLEPKRGGNVMTSSYQGTKEGY